MVTPGNRCVRWSEPVLCAVVLSAVVLLAGFNSKAVAGDLSVPGGIIDVQFTSAPSQDLRSSAMTWVANSARAVSTYYGTFPVRRAVLRITPQEGSKPKGGKAFGWSGALVTIGLGRNASDASLADDWLLPHEMLHLGFPNVAERHHWLEEGLATYIEPIARARAGLISAEEAWGDLVRGLPQGQPETGDRGLDFTPTWGRTYWGGALFCLRVDVEARRRTGNRRGLEHALRAIVAADGTIESSWKIDRVIATGDAATGVPVLREVYDEMKAAPAPVDLAAMWRQLGIIRRGRGVIFDDSAPLATVRKAIISG